MQNFHPAIYILFILAILVSSCTPEDESMENPELSTYQLEVIDYFKDVALGYEFGNASEITRKWNTPMKVFVGGEPTLQLISELESIKNEINALATDGFFITTVADSASSNFYIFFGPGEKYAKYFPSETDYVISNWGLFSTYWGGDNFLIYGHMYVDTERAKLVEQMHLLREELTQSLGLAKDSYLYPESIFQQDWTKTTDYAPIDKDLIRLLYHPQITAGLNAGEVENILATILMAED